MPNRGRDWVCLKIALGVNEFDAIRALRKNAICRELWNDRRRTNHTEEWLSPAFTEGRQGAEQSVADGNVS